jgi:signal transduction histidine kinase
MVVVAFGVGWFLSGLTLRPIDRITKTAQDIGDERDFSKRVSHTGKQDEIGRLAGTFNQMLARLQEAYQKVEKSLDQQREFVSDVSHELRTPLTTLRGNLGLLKHEPPLPKEEQGDILTDMVDESDRMIRLVNELLLLAHADAGRSLAKEFVNLNDIIQEVVRAAQQLEDQRNILVDLAPELTVIGDKDAFKQILLILLDNALKYSETDVFIKAAIFDPMVEISVQDLGRGISTEDMQHVFNRFYRAEEQLTATGFGLGLPIAKSLVERMDGTIELESELGKGTKAVVSFPIKNTAN